MAAVCSSFVAVAKELLAVAVQAGASRHSLAAMVVALARAASGPSALLAESLAERVDDVVAEMKQRDVHGEAAGRPFSHSHL